MQHSTKHDQRRLGLFAGAVLLAASSLAFADEARMWTYYRIKSREGGPPRAGGGGGEGSDSAGGQSGQPGGTQAIGTGTIVRGVRRCSELGWLERFLHPYRECVPD